MENFTAAMEEARMSFFYVRMDDAEEAAMKTEEGRKINLDFKNAIGILQKQMPETLQDQLLNLEAIASAKFGLMREFVYEQGFKDGLKMSREGFELWTR
jgi:hypothetical protein